MSDAAIEVVDLSKRFRIYHERNQSIKIALMRGRRASFEEFWALRDVSFEISTGSTFGLIGPNGSGKSTLLKCLAQILVPDSGRVVAHGSMSALLELGAGFHPELSGRDNVYLNGSILGLSRREIDRRFDEIVGFAGLEHFIDTPVKNYSSGMYVRLGFSVAINVEPEILLVDEVLAVGDEEFQTKCMDKFRQFKADGRTVVLVSHALGALRQMCDQVALLDHGQLQIVGDPAEVLDAYVGAVHSEHTGAIPGQNRWGSGEVLIDKVEVLVGGRGVDAPATGDDVTLRLHWSTSAPVAEVVFGVIFHTLDGKPISGPNTMDEGFVIDCRGRSGTVDLQLDRLLLVAGEYDLALAAYDTTITHAYDHHHNAFRLRMRAGGPGDRHGVVTFAPRWDAVPAPKPYKRWLPAGQRP